MSVTTGTVSIASFAIAIGAPIGFISASFSLAFSISTGLLKETLNKKKKHNKIVMLARNKLNSMESKISKDLINNEISHEVFLTTIEEEKNISRTKKKH